MSRSRIQALTLIAVLVTALSLILLTWQIGSAGSASRAPGTGNHSTTPGLVR